MDTPQDRVGCTAVVGFLTLLGVAWALTVSPLAVGVRLLNGALAISFLIAGVVMLWRERRVPAPSVLNLLRTWLWVVLTAGGTYFLLHQVRPTAFVIDEAIQRNANAAAIEQRVDAFDDAMMKLRLIDAAILASPQDRRFVFDGTTWEVSLNPIPDRPNSSRPSMTRVEISPVLLPQEGRRSVYWTMLQDGSTLDQYMLRARRLAATQSALTSAFAPDTHSYSIFDYLYFALMLPGSDVIKPNETFTRMLAVLQFFVFVGLGYRQPSDGRA